MSSPVSTPYSAFNKLGLRATVAAIIAHIKELYLADQIPWVVGYSGGKDSTAVLQLVWSALQELKQEGNCHKDVHVISTDTLVENPIVAMWVEKSLERMLEAKVQQGIPIQPHRLTPAVKDRFWVNLIGKGYPAPRYKFRWCTDRLKISPSNNFINNLVDKRGEAILVLGTRKAESSTRAATMEHYENIESNTRRADGLTANGTLDRVWVYPPIANWTNDDVWVYLNSVSNPWNFPNQDLMGMYQGATEGGECPLVVDKSTQSCGDSRFGCYVCTMVSEDKSMSAMIANDEEKEWMYPLLALRNEIDVNDVDHNKKLDKLRRDKSRRDFRRMNGSLTVHITKNGADIVPGPYIQSFREELLEKVLQAQIAVQKMGPVEVKNLELLPQEELEEIRRIWLEEKLEVEDSLPVIYQKVMGKPYPGARRAHHPILNKTVLDKLRTFCAANNDAEGLMYQQIRATMAVANRHKNQLRRANLTTELMEILEKGAFSTLDEAKVFALERKRFELKIQYDNSPNLSDKEKESINEQIAIITRSIKERGYSSLLIETEVVSDDI
ncbi:DNA phosphorothioation system sulfurtransferase DndC [Salmonella enterica subsp. enterica serovar Newport]|uniref:DNA phosphorothioation system sulfurtransferase DndC n=1 Tax=Salmonella newport TaxID=108619 RepID=A0A3U2ZX56_SALNE|nr:DNA phosphorothioation system sulfurtransferase DndC [Salmonella enterica]EAA7578405.1 DNA phosphorothioation system sulfurtransferase DndC [Salmonella enterica subsp. enterica]EBK2662355.1 DNA phosphorothioation system sulfurtransferase DndC [Salmonella enterica subsp. enterica serovar Enteritidis]ECN0309751.1 DNA phosphorothioation system sulfurtransferase DndC [Salmonella enterica subsp. enterica serovar Typhi]EDV9371955.1 DNA phosphorothioation system sulfurtransferase DndC [Salmonella e